MEDQPRSSNVRSQAHVVDERPDPLFQNSLIGCPKVDQVNGVEEHRPQTRLGNALPVGFLLRLRHGFEGPALRRGTEYLDCLAPDFLGPCNCLADSSCGGDMGANSHRFSLAF